MGWIGIRPNRLATNMTSNILEGVSSEISQLLSWDMYGPDLNVAYLDPGGTVNKKMGCFKSRAKRFRFLHKSIQKLKCLE